MSSCPPAGERYQTLKSPPEARPRYSCHSRASPNWRNTYPPLARRRIWIACHCPSRLLVASNRERERELGGSTPIDTNTTGSFLKASETEPTSS